VEIFASQCAPPRINDTNDKFDTCTASVDCHRCMSTWEQYQTAYTLKLTWKKIHLYVNSSTPRWPNKIFKTFLIEDFFHLPSVSMTMVVHLELWISPGIFRKNWNSPNGILRESGACGQLIHEKNLKSKISWHCP
jgi:hypothetical protein